MKFVSCTHAECIWTVLVGDDKADRTRDAHCWSTHRCVGDHRLVNA